MQKTGWIQWFVRVIRKDMSQYEEDVKMKRELYQTVKSRRAFKTDKGAKEQ